MMPLLTTPLAALAAVALPTLVGIYWLRTRYRTRVVSSLLLWSELSQVREGGLKVTKFQSNLLFILELIVLSLLVLAATTPYWPLGTSARPLVVILDDSFSMSAEGERSPQSRARTALEAELARRAVYSIRFLLAGEEPQVLGEPIRDVGEALHSLDRWKCQATSANLDRAIGLAVELGGEHAAILVLSDHAPAGPLEQGQVQWWAFGEPKPNLAFTAASRTLRDGRDRCFLEIANHADEPQTTTLTVHAGDHLVLQKSITLKSEEASRQIFELQGVGSVAARIGLDGLRKDNEVWLAPATRHSIHVENRLSHPEMKKVVDKALKSLPDVHPSASDPHLVFTEAEASDADWQVRLHIDEEAEAYTGTFLIERTHPLAEGLQLKWEIWAGGKDASLPGTAIVQAGNTTLLALQETSRGRHLIHLRLRPDLSTLQSGPNFPILMYNIMQYRGSFLPGLSRTNLRHGELAHLVVGSETKRGTLTWSEGETQDLPIHEGRAQIRGDRPGLNKISIEDHEYPFACNFLSAEESDLRKATTGRWGTWVDDHSLRTDYYSLVWLLLLMCLGLLTVHLWLANKDLRSLGTQ
jgi:hypothetical protein